MEKLRKYSFYVVALTLSFLFVFFILEFFHAKFYYHKLSNPLGKNHFSHQPQPYSMFIPKGGYQSSLKEILKEKPEGEYRLFLLGGAPYHTGKDLLGNFLQEKFHNDGKNHVKVYDFTVDSTIFTQDVMRLFHELLDYKPDKIVFFHGFNEITFPYFADPRPGFPYNFKAYEENPLLKSFEEYPGRDLFFFASSIMRGLYKQSFLRDLYKLDDYRQEVGYLTQAWEQKIIDEYWRNIKRLDDLKKVYNFEYSLIIQPMLMRKKRLGPREKIVLDGMSREAFNSYKRLVRKFFITLKLSELPLYDLSELFAIDKDEVYIDMSHTGSGYGEKTFIEIYRLLSSDTPEA